MNKMRTIGRLIIRFFSDCKEFSIGVAYARMYRDCPWIEWNKRREKYENAIYFYLKRNYSYVISSLNDQEDKDFAASMETIWVMWWQGEEKMPPIVKASYNQLKKEQNNRNVILITKNNVYNYVTVPPYLKTKIESGKISLTHFSDIVRVMLLEQYGGLWVDATVYVSQLPSDFFRQSFFTLKKDGMFMEFISRGRWSTFLLYTKNQNTVFFKGLRMLFFTYWKEHGKIIDYLMFDYFIKIMQDILPQINEMFKETPDTEGFYDLNLILNDAFDSIKFDQICASNFFHKLTYKKQFSDVDKLGKETFYHYLINRN